ncbi:MAG: glucose 1-dehydrogenase [Candidatus Lokiarchaeota archaeon]|nr:glucose 1-dehydrogenase [Candidatus Lokiarchaeota archaeon]
MTKKSISELCFGIEDQTAIVTGGSSGLGVTFAEALAEAGANVIISARRLEKLKDVAETIMAKTDAKVIPVEADVTNEDQVIAMVQKAIDEFDSLEIIVNNAGISAMDPSIDMSLAEWKKVIDVNLTGVFLTARTAAREMIKHEYGKIINIASIYGAVGDRFQAAPYYASKAAVINLTRAFAIEWAEHKINVNGIAPGFFPSEMTEEIFKDDELKNLIVSRTALGRTGKPFDLKGAVIYLSSPASNYMTGQTLFIDGGWTAL